MSGLLSRAGRKPRPTSPSPGEILRAQLSDEQWDQLQTLGRFEVQGKAGAYKVGLDGCGHYCIGLEDEWWGDEADEEAEEYDDCARMLALKQLIESDEALFLHVVDDSSHTTRERTTGAEDES